LYKIEKEINRGGFPGPVGAQQAENMPGPDVQIEIYDGGFTIIIF
jgi:hypothetical protein